MSEDIRISIDFLTNRKRKKVQLKLGAEGVLSLIDFWLSTAVQRPLGTLTNYSIEDIEIDANWGGEPGLFVKTLLEVGFLDEKDGVYSLHNWNVRQGWVSGTEERADKARFSRLARSNPSLYRELKAKGVDSISKEDYQKRKKSFNESSTVVNEPLNESSTVVEEDSTPSPSPSPSPTPNVKENPGTAPGIFSDFDKKVKPKANGRGDNNSIDTAGYFKAINQACLQIYKLPPKQKTFNPHKWAQQQITNNRHPGAVAESLEGLVMFWQAAESPWSYVSTILKTKNGNWNEADAIKIHEEMKALNPKDLEVLTHGLFKNIRN